MICSCDVKIHCQTSIYYSFPDSAASWNYQFTMNCLNGTISDETYSYILDQDTIINAIVYHKLIVPNILSNSSGTCNSHAAGYLGAVRENTTAKKIYFIPPGTSIEELLYDFNLQAGDTIKGYLPASTPSLLTVQSVDSVLAGTTYRKRWKTNSCYFADIIEGIGSTYGLIEKIPWCETDMAHYSLLCCKQNDSALYPISGSDCNLITNYYNAGNKQQEVIVISPNPAGGIINIKTKGKILESVVIFDLAGRIVLAKKNHSTTYNIDMPSGFYLLELIVEGSVIKRSVIIK